MLGLSLIGVAPGWSLMVLMTLLSEISLAMTLVLVLLQLGANAAGFGWSMAAITYYAVRTLRAESPTVGEAAGQALRKVPHVVAAYFLVYLAVTLGFFLLVVPGVVLWLMFWVAVPAATIEGGVTSALRRSHELTNGHKWPLLGVLAVLLLSLLALIVVVALTLTAATSSLLVQQGAAGLLQAVIWAVWSVVAAASYYHLRLAAEGGAST